MSDECDTCSCGIANAEEREVAALPMDLQETIRDRLDVTGAIDGEDEFLSAVVVCPESTRVFVTERP